MSYNITRNAVDRMTHYLEILVENEMDKVFFESDNPSSLAYRLREAIFAVRKYPECSQFHTLYDEYRIGVRINGVECIQGIRDGAHVPVPAQRVGTIHLPEITTLTGLLGAAIRFKHTDELVFENVNLHPADKLHLYEWTGQRDWQYIDHLGAGLTLTKQEVDEELLWTPEGE